MRVRDAILHAHGRDVTALYRGDEVWLSGGRRGLVVRALAGAQTLVMLTPRQFVAVATGDLTQVAAGEFGTVTEAFLLA